MNQDLFYIANKECKSRLLHCFGNGPKDILSPDTAVELIKITGTEFLTIYTHGVLPKNIKDFPIGYAGLKYSDISENLDLSAYTLLINTNHAATKREAIERAERAAEVTGINWIKLEVLSKDADKPINGEVIEAARHLIEKGYIVLPIITGDIVAAKELEEMGCSSVRILMSEIGSMKGLVNPTIFERLRSEIVIPIIAEGGIASPTDVHRVMAMGIDAVLINKALFCSNNPLAFAKAMREAAILGRHEYREAVNCEIKNER